MKIIALTLTALLALFMQNCKENIESEGDTALVKIEILNLSDKKVRIMLFHSNQSIFKDANINSLDSVILDEGFIHPAPGPITYKLTLSSIDSAQIIFADGKKLIQTYFKENYLDTINNLLRRDDYKTFESQNPSFARLQFTLNQSDYLRAK